jgi:hypothetical protein
MFSCGMKRCLSFNLSLGVKHESIQPQGFGGCCCNDRLRKRDGRFAERNDDEHGYCREFVFDHRAGFLDPVQSPCDEPRVQFRIRAQTADRLHRSRLTKARTVPATVPLLLFAI